jgi:prophage antirepressor-like protein
MSDRDKSQAIVVFESLNIRRKWYQSEWWFSVSDVVAALTEQSDLRKARKYWNKLAQRLRDEGSEVVTNCHQLKLKAPDGKFRKTD